MRADAFRRRAEAAAIDELYVPLVRRVFIRRGAKIEVEVPLVARYVFARFDASDVDWDFINKAPGFLGMLQNCGAVLAVPERDIDRLRELVVAAGRIRQTKMSAEFVEGEKLRVMDGPFASFPATVTRVIITKGMPRYIAEVTIFNRSTPVEFEQSQLERIKTA